MKAQGTSPATCNPLAFITGDQAYQVEVEISIEEGTSGGLVLFYNNKMYAGVGFQKGNIIRHRTGLDITYPAAGIGNHLFIRLINDHHVVSAYYSSDGIKWEKTSFSFEVSGYHQNVIYGFLSLRPALYAAGKGEVTFRNFKYKAL